MSDTLIDQFVPEASDLLETVTSSLLELEGNPQDENAVNRVFRAIHTLKGTAGIFEIPPFVELAHAAEDLLGAVRDREVALDPEAVDELLAGTDKLAAWVSELSARGRLPADARTDSKYYCGLYRARLNDRSPPGAAAERPTTDRDAVQAVFDPEVFDDDARRAAFAAWAEDAKGVGVIAVSYRPERECFYKGEDPLHLLRQIDPVHDVTIGFRDGERDLDSLDMFACELGFELLTTAPRSEIEHLFRFISDQVEIIDVDPRHLIHPVGDDPAETLPEALLTEIDRLAASGDLAGLRSAIDGLTGCVEPACRQASAASWLRTVLAMDEPPVAWVAALTDVLAGRAKTYASAVRRAELPAEPMIGTLTPRGREILDAQLRILDIEPGSGAWSERVPSCAETLARVLDPQRTHVSKAIARAQTEALQSGRAEPLLTVCAPMAGDGPPELQAAAGEPASSQTAPMADGNSAGSPAAADRVLKVEQRRVDALMDLVGELIVAKNALPYLAKRAEGGASSGELAREIKAQYGSLDRIAQEMQGAIMAVRMMPVGTLFQRYPRLVRDTARRLGKQINLVLEGEDTEADKNVIEALADPLLHIVRNSLDHGFETAEDRLAQGKAERGDLRIRAYQDGDRVCIDVTDDGRGIDPERVKAKALEKGLIDANRAASLADQDAIQLVFAAGFSTKDEASDLSGRGVGMDVVRTAVEQFGGDVSLDSVRGRGTTVSLRLPLSMAVSRVMMVEVGDGLFGIPIDYVAETVRLDRRDIRRFKQAETFLLRNAVVPLVRLRDRLAMEPDTRARDTEAVLVCRLHGAPVGLVVDEFNVGMDVVLKPMTGILSGMPGFAGTSVLGNGQILLVLNLKELA